LRDRALIGLLVFTFARIGAALSMTVAGYLLAASAPMGPTPRKRRQGTRDARHHSLETYLQDYIEAAGLASDREGVLFRTSYRRTGVLTDRAMTQSDAWRMLQRRARDAGIPTAVCNHTSAPPASPLSRQRRSLENAQPWPSESPRTTKLYDRTDDRITLMK